MVLALAFTVQAQAQDEIPTSEAFAKDCLDDMIFFVQQITETLRKVEANLDELDPQLKEDIDTAFARLNIKSEVCKDLAEILGEDYVIHLEKVRESSGIKLAAYKLIKALEKIALQYTPDLAKENQLPWIVCAKPMF